MKKMKTLLLVVILGCVASGLDIVVPPPDHVWVKESESVEFFCMSDQPWQWCYWEVQPNQSENKTKRYKTTHVSQTWRVVVAQR